MPARVPAATLEGDLDTIQALEALADYDPRNKGYSTQNAQAARERFTAARDHLARLERDIAAARDAVVREGKALHEIIIGARNEVSVQYGPDSDAVQSVGRKKVSQRKSPSPRRQTPASGMG